MKDWLCSQYGARERYAIPRSLFRAGALDAFVTDMWIKPESPIVNVFPRAQSRFHEDLRNAPVQSFNSQFLSLSLLQKAHMGNGPTDSLFDSRLASLIARKERTAEVFFGYSYSSRQSMKAAKEKGYITVLGQINPGPLEAELVIEEYKKFDTGRHKPFVPDPGYWDLWQEEVANSDLLIVNSGWSRHLLARHGIDEKKMVEVPLCFEEKIEQAQRTFVKSFSSSRPLRLLYLGGLELRKGFHILLEAMRTLTNQPVQLEVVGSLKGPESLLANLPSNVTYKGVVPPNKVAGYYTSCDVFVFPTLSDGFGLTLLEAQAHRVPVISTLCCADVITDGVNGWVLKEVSAESIRNAIMEIIDNPELVEKYSGQAVDMRSYSIDRLIENLKNIPALK